MNLPRNAVRHLSALTAKLKPAVLAVKAQTESLLRSNRADYVLYNKNTDAGITDLSFENRETEELGKKRAVSVYFKMDKEGIRAYRKAAKSLADDLNVELSYTPHFGQSRITFQWEYFWATVNGDKLGLLPPEALQQLASSADTELKKR